MINSKDISTDRIRNKISDLHESVANLRNDRKNILHSISMLRGLGYCMLFLAIFDLVVIFIPPDFMNPVWELKTFGELVERIPIPLIGLTLIFLGNREERLSWEIPLIMKSLSIVALLSGLVIFFLIPLIFIDTVRINDAMIMQVKSEINTQKKQSKQAKNQLKKIKNIEEIEQFITTFTIQGQVPEINDQISLDKMKTDLSRSLSIAERSVIKEAHKSLYSQQLIIIKNSVKWTLGAFIGGIMFINIWRWSRKMQWN